MSVNCQPKEDKQDQQDRETCEHSRRDCVVEIHCEAMEFVELL